MIIEMRQRARIPVPESRSFSLGLISFKRLDWNDLVANLVDRSEQGVGIEANGPVEPGFVWFDERVDGAKGGLLLWSKRIGPKYRGGIRFISLSPEEEDRVQRKLRNAGVQRDPTDVVDALLNSIRKSGEDPSWQGRGKA